MAKGDAGGGGFGKAMGMGGRFGNAMGAMNPAGGGGFNMSPMPQFAQQFARANPNFGGGRFGSMQPVPNSGIDTTNKPPAQAGGYPGGSYDGSGIAGPWLNRKGGFGMPQIQPNPAFEQAYGNARSAGMDFPAAMDAAQGQMGQGGGFRMPAFGGIAGGLGRRGMMF